MSYTMINPIPQFNFQINRVLTYGDLACNSKEIKMNLPSVRTFEEWYAVWSGMGRNAESIKHYLHAAYYYRMAEFFLRAI